MCLWSNSVSRLDHLRAAEATLIQLAKSYGDRDENSYEIVTKDTPIPFKSLPLKEKKRKKDENLYLHSVCARAIDDSLQDETKSERIATPLVLLHGYMNGAMYFYRNLAGLTGNFETVYSLDMLGCGLSSRRPKLLKSDVENKTVQATEALFVDSLEAWRKANGISKMILGGHSLGGYIGVCYCEKYPQYVEQLQLYSPAGVNHPDMERITDWLENLPWQKRIVTKGAKWAFEKGLTPGIVIRNMPGKRGRGMVENYVQKRMPGFDVTEQQALADYLYYNAILPGTGEYMLNRLLTASSHARVPTVDRIPNLKVRKVGFLYGSTDWMETDGGVEVLEKCRTTDSESPTIDVFEVVEAGHLLMLDNWRGFHGGVLTICESEAAGEFPRPERRLELQETVQPLYFAKFSHDLQQSNQRSAASSMVSERDFASSSRDVSSSSAASC
jgi:cardiolipin-specific phospholipase